MNKVTKTPQNSAYIEVKQAIKGLQNFYSEDNEDDVMYTTNKLNSVLRMVHDNYQSWTTDAIREFILNKNDPLRYINIKSETFNHMVRKIQEDMIVKFS